MRYLYRGGGIPAVIAWVVRALLSPLYYREARHIVAQKIPERSPRGFVDRERESADGECLILESPEALRTVEREIPSSITHPLESLRKYLEQGCVIFLVFCPKRTEQERAFVGYGIDRRGVLSVLGREKAVPFDILCGRYLEILPEYR